MTPNAALAVYASQASASRGRQYGTADAASNILPLDKRGDTRSHFQRDRDRIIHSVAFRRLQQKTQVFIADTFAAGTDISGYFRSRLTHSLEVAQIARGISRHFLIDEDLTEAVALAHDLGHPPFGHAGERALKEAMEKHSNGKVKFDHNEQTIRVMTMLEHCYADCDGLDLTWELLEGVAKHNGPIKYIANYPTIANLDKVMKLELDNYASLEAQIANFADDIAYVAHDCEDGIRSGLLDPEEMRKSGVSLVGDILTRLREVHGNMQLPRLTHELTRRVINLAMSDVIEYTQQQIAELNPQSADDIRQCGKAMVGFSPVMKKRISELKKYLGLHFWQHYKVNRTTSRSRHMLVEIFGRLMDDKERNLFPPSYADVSKMKGEQRARRVADYLASMTDSEAQMEYTRLFGPVAVMPSLV